MVGCAGAVAGDGVVFIGSIWHCLCEFLPFI